MKRQLAHTDDMSLASCAIRLKAAILVTGLRQKALCDQAKVNEKTLSAMVTGVQHPNKNVMQYFYREHRIDFNFLMAGVYSQLPGDVQDRLLPALVTANNEWDRREGSNPAPSNMRNKPA